MTVVSALVLLYFNEVALGVRVNMSEKLTRDANAPAPENGGHMGDHMAQMREAQMAHRDNILRCIRSDAVVDSATCDQSTKAAFHELVNLVQACLGVGKVPDSSNGHLVGDCDFADLRIKAQLKGAMDYLQGSRARGPGILRAVAFRPMDQANVDEADGLVNTARKGLSYLEAVVVLGKLDAALKILTKLLHQGKDQFVPAYAHVHDDYEQAKLIIQNVKSAINMQ